MSSYGKFVPTSVTAANLPQYPFIAEEIVLVKDTGQVAYGTGAGPGQYQFIAGGSGESNTASNVGSGAGSFAQKSGVDLQLRSIVSSDSSLNITQNASEIDLVSNLGTVAGKYSNFQQKVATESTSSTAYITYYTYTVPVGVVGTSHLLLTRASLGSTQVDSEAYMDVRLNGTSLYTPVKMRFASNTFDDHGTSGFKVVSLSSGDTVTFHHKADINWMSSTVKEASVFIMSLD